MGARVKDPAVKTLEEYRDDAGLLEDLVQAIAEQSNRVCMDSTLDEDGGWRMTILDVLFAKAKRVSRELHYGLDVLTTPTGKGGGA